MIDELLGKFRKKGWAVAVHNDYRQGGESHTFWLFTRGTRFVKGEGPSDEVALLRAWDEVEKLNKLSFCCYDCSAPHPPEYMVHDHVWRQAFPAYGRIKRELTAKYKATPESYKGHVFLCFACLEARLARKLEPSDFNLKLPINLGIALGLEMGRLEGDDGAP